MNVKKYSLKAMCAALTCTMSAGNLLPVFATDTIITETPLNDSVETVTSDSGWTTEENTFEDVKVTYTQSSSYFVTIPKTIALGVNKQAVYPVKVTGEIDTKQRVYVAPVDGIAKTENIDFYMKEKGNKKEDVIATVTQNKTYWSSEEVASGHEENNNVISAPELTTGTWEGIFQMEIRLEAEQEQEHTHNYVDGKCECGEIDPNHEHNYVDNVCTICGNEIDPYEVAPVSAIDNWNYTLDDENNIITLNYYTGSEADVIVYANYVADGKIYKTKIANGTSGYITPYMFAKKSMIQTIKFSKDIDTSNVTDMSYMFGECISLRNLDISNFNTSNVKYMDFMFYNCQNLTELDLSNFDTSKVTNMYRMFNNDRGLTHLNLSSFDTSNVTNMESMFNECRSLVTLDLSNFDTGKVTNMQQMFEYCISLESLDLSDFDTSNVTNMMQMFYACNSLTSLDLDSFNTGNVTKMNYMFGSCSNLKTIYVTRGKWSTSKATTTNMFNSCGTSTVTYVD